MNSERGYMKKKNIYIDISHLDYWWGIYKYKNLTDWEDVIIYEKWGKGFRKLAWTCICSNLYFHNGLEDLREEEDEREFVKKIDRFLESNETVYHYYYDKPDDKDFYEVPFEAERNALNIKPRSIETWYPCEGIDKNIIDNVVRDFCRKFLNIETDIIIYKNEVSLEMAQDSYIESEIQLKKCLGIKVTDNLIEDLGKELNMSKEKIEKLINRSI